MTMTVMTTMVMTAMMTMTMTMMSVVQCLSRPATFTQNFQRRARTTAALLFLWATGKPDGIIVAGIETARREIGESSRSDNDAGLVFLEENTM